MLTLSKNKNQHLTLYLAPQRAGEWTIQKEFLLWLSEIVQTFQNTHLSGRPTYLFQMEGGER